MNKEIKAIETRYKGYRFRSRLEARWAVFFDTLGIVWEYEPEGFELQNQMYYLPDFRIFGTDTNGEKFSFWVEVKPLEYVLTEQDALKFGAFCSVNIGKIKTTINHLILAVGMPEIKKYKEFDSGFNFILWSHRKRPWYVEFEDWIDGGPHYAIDTKYHLSNTLEVVRDKFVFAVNAARSARFEFGQSGATNG